MENIWARPTELGLSGDELREQVQLHIARHLGPAEPAFIDADGWAGKSKEPGPPIDVLVAPPEGERRFAYVASFGASLTPMAFDEPEDADRTAPSRHVEFTLAVPQSGAPAADRAMLSLAASTVRQFAKLIHLQPVRVATGDTVAFADPPRPVFEGSEQCAFVFMEPRLPGEGFETMQTPSRAPLRFVSPVPIYPEELDAGHMRGGLRLITALHLAHVTEMIDLRRPRVMRRIRRGPLGWIDRLADRFAPRKR